MSRQWSHRVDRFIDVVAFGKTTIIPPRFFIDNMEQILIIPQHFPSIICSKYRI